MSEQELTNLRNKVYILFKKDIITAYDIELISNWKLNEIESLEVNFKNQVLNSIYNHPYLVCNDYMFIDGTLYVDISLIAKLLIRRFNMEVNELEYQLNEGYISKEYYQFEINKLNNLYFDSSIIGRRIYNIYNQDIILESVCDKQIILK